MRMFRWVILWMLGGFTLVTAQNQGKLNIGVINMQAIILKVEEGKAAKAEIEKEMEGKGKAIEEMKKKFEKVQKDAEAQIKMMTPDQRMAKEKELYEMGMKIQQSIQEAQNYATGEQRKRTDKIAAQIAEMATAMAKEKKLDILFEQSTSGVIYLADYKDISEEIAKAYDAKYPVKKK